MRRSASWLVGVLSLCSALTPLAVAKSSPGGYTLLMMSNPHTVNESLIPDKPFRLLRDSVPAVVHVPYKGSPGARIDILGGEVHMMFGAITRIVKLSAARPDR